MRVRVKQASSSDNVKKIDSLGKIEKIENSGETIDMFFRGVDSSGILSMTPRELESMSTLLRSEVVKSAIKKAKPKRKTRKAVKRAVKRKVTRKKTKKKR
jgi:hypothetical protein